MLGLWWCSKHSTMLHSGRRYSQKSMFYWNYRSQERESNSWHADGIQTSLGYFWWDCTVGHLVNDWELLILGFTSLNGAVIQARHKCCFDCWASSADGGTTLKQHSDELFNLHSHTHSIALLMPSSLLNYTIAISCVSSIYISVFSHTFLVISVNVPFVLWDVRW